MGFAKGKNPVSEQYLTMAPRSRDQGRLRFARNSAWRGGNRSANALDSRNRPVAAPPREPIRPLKIRRKQVAKAAVAHARQRIGESDATIRSGLARFTRVQNNHSRRAQIFAPRKRQES
jgi:hypothetical protein